MNLSSFRRFVVAILALVSATGVFAATYTVTPVRVELKPGERSYLLNLRNDSDKKLRFQISVHEWAQSVDGEAQLTPSDALVAFPGLLTLEPGTERKVRLGLTRPFPADRETTFRVIFEELPDAVTPTSGAQVQIVTKMSIPVFVQPRQLQQDAAIADARVENGVLKFDVRNPGNTYFIVNGVTVTGRKADQSAFSKNLQGWYVLAGGRREYVVPLTSADCENLTAIELQVATDIRRNNDQLIVEATVPVKNCNSVKEPDASGAVR